MFGCLNDTSSDTPEVENRLTCASTLTTARNFYDGLKKRRYSAKQDDGSAFWCPSVPLARISFA